MFLADTDVPKYQDDSDFNEAFKNLLRPVDTLTKKKQCEPLQYNLMKVILYLNTYNILLLYNITYVIIVVIMYLLTGTGFIFILLERIY